MGSKGANKNVTTKRNFRWEGAAWAFDKISCVAAVNYFFGTYQSDEPSCSGNWSATNTKKREEEYHKTQGCLDYGPHSFWSNHKFRENEKMPKLVDVNRNVVDGCPSFPVVAIACLVDIGLRPVSCVGGFVAGAAKDICCPSGCSCSGCSPSENPSSVPNTKQNPPAQMTMA